MESAVGSIKNHGENPKKCLLLAGIYPIYFHVDSSYSSTRWLFFRAYFCGGFVVESLAKRAPSAVLVGRFTFFDGDGNPRLHLWFFGDQLPLGRVEWISTPLFLGFCAYGLFLSKNPDQSKLCVEIARLASFCTPRDLLFFRDDPVCPRGGAGAYRSNE